MTGARDDEHGAVGESLRLMVIGATGRTGNAVVHALGAQPGVELVACIAPSVASTPTRPLPEGVAAFATLHEVDVEADIVVDLGVAGAVPSHLATALSRGWHTIIGATAFDLAAVTKLGDEFRAAGLGLLIVPNFSVGAVLMMYFASVAARYLPDAAIIEQHHSTKVDAPSGTAMRTAQLIASARPAHVSAPVEVAVGVGSGGVEAPRNDSDIARAASPEAGTYGLDVEGVPVHALRLAGATAHQDVVFSGIGEVLTITHDAIDRSCYAAGVALAARQVTASSGLGLNIGLEL
ncbi:MAG: 4-hydroxy-tetrahydrodipicolinate reductase [Thermoleophilia bacterium]|nr:4-hydroxy-tetrahydrodipicolinate reductase [Thermoleophilia bacterium]